MCRITGFWDFSARRSYRIDTVITAMRDTMIAGGPDDAGIFTQYEVGLALAHRRLSIIDLSAAACQPMTSLGNRYTLVFNGEIYNYREIRRELETMGHIFRSRSDSEVVLIAFMAWGHACVSRFRGMWAFAIWDSSAKKLHLCRDRMGVKPLYWYYHNGLFAFASELKALLPHPRFDKQLAPAALALFLQYGYINAPDAIFEHTWKVEPGAFLTIDEKGTIEHEKYWQIDPFFNQAATEKAAWLKRSDDEVATELEGILTESFQLRMIADVPVGMFLSGGIDSSLVTALLQKESTKPLQTFTIGFHENQYNEAHWAKQIAAHLHTDHTELYCTPREAIDIIPQLPQIYDEPFGDPSAIPTFLVARLARQQVKVSLSADGGDELFCGYRRYFGYQRIFTLLRHGPFAPISRFLFSRISPATAYSVGKHVPALQGLRHNFRDNYVKMQHALRAASDLDAYHRMIRFNLPEDLRNLGLTNIPEHDLTGAPPLDLLSRMLWLDLRTYLPGDILTKVDRATMAVSLEGREPLLDHHIVEYAARMPVHFKYRQRQSKFILRKILHKYVPPALLERPKMGFSIPIYEWLGQDLRDLYQTYLHPDRIRREGLFDPAAIERLKDDYQNKRGGDIFKIWNLLMFEMWSEKYWQS